MKTDLHFNSYKKLRDQIDLRIAELEKEHNAHLNCKAGCSMCCREYAILPIEFDYIKEQISGETSIVYNDSYGKDECPFLVNNRCSIYSNRPFICRSHGLPILYMGEEAWELSACELNFTKVADDYFTMENTYAQDTINSKLYMLNSSYLEETNKEDQTRNPLISIQQLIQGLKNGM